MGDSSGGNNAQSNSSGAAPSNAGGGPGPQSVPAAPQQPQAGPGGTGQGPGTVRPGGPNGNIMPNGIASSADMNMVNSVVTSTQMGVPQQQQQQQGIQQLRPPQPGQVVSMAGNPNINLVNALTTGGPNKMQGQQGPPQQPNMPNGPMMSVGMPVSSGDMNTVTTINNGNIMPGQQRPMGNMPMNPMGMQQNQQQPGGPMMQKQQIMMPNRPPIMMQPFQQRPMVNARMANVRMQPPQNVMVSSGPPQQFMGASPVINTSAGGTMQVQQQQQQQRMVQPNAPVMNQQVQPAPPQQPGPVNLPPRYPNKMEGVVQINQQQPNLGGPNQQQTQQQQQPQQQQQLNQPAGK